MWVKLSSWYLMDLLVSKSGLCSDEVGIWESVFKLSGTSIRRVSFWNKKFSKNKKRKKLDEWKRNKLKNRFIKRWLKIRKINWIKNNLTI